MTPAITTEVVDAVQKLRHEVEHPHAQLGYFSLLYAISTLDKAGLFAPVDAYIDELTARATGTYTGKENRP